MTPGGQAQIGNVDLVKQLNSAAVYRLIDQYGPISRIQIAEQSQLAPRQRNQNYASAYRTRADQRS